MCLVVGQMLLKLVHATYPRNCFVFLILPRGNNCGN
jgi:hypothetical protein